MKCIRKQFFITATAVFIGNASLAQTVASGFLRSQMEVDAFNFTTVTGRLIIDGSDITNLSNLSGLTSIGTLTIQNNPNLTSLVGLEALTSVSDLSIESNSELTNLSGLNNLTHATILVDISDNSTLTSLEGLEGLTAIGSLGLTILSNAVLSTLNGLENLTSLSGKLFIGTSNDGVFIKPNPALINFCAISQLVTGDDIQITTSEYFVVNNEYNPTHAGLASGTVETATDMNDGCAEFGTVLPVPVPPVVVSTNTFSKEEDYRLFPNPVSDVLFVKSESKITSITISSLSGQEVLKSNSGSINVRNLSKGIYFARIVSGEKTIVEKFVKL